MEVSAVKNLFQANPRYGDFTVLDSPKPYKEIFAGVDIRLVGIHCVYDCDDIKKVLHAGQCSYVENFRSRLEVYCE